MISQEGVVRQQRSRRCAVPPQAAHLHRLGNLDYQDAFAVHVDRCVVPLMLERVARGSAIQRGREVPA